MKKTNRVKDLIIIIIIIVIIILFFWWAMGKTEYLEPYTITGEVTSVNIDRCNIYVTVKADNGKRYTYSGRSNSSSISDSAKAFSLLVLLSKGDNITLTVTPKKIKYLFIKEVDYYEYVTNISFNNWLNL